MGRGTKPNRTFESERSSAVLLRCEVDEVVDEEEEEEEERNVYRVHYG